MLGAARLPATRSQLRAASARVSRPFLRTVTCQEAADKVTGTKFEENDPKKNPQVLCVCIYVSQVLYGCVSMYLSIDRSIYLSIVGRACAMQ